MAPSSARLSPRFGACHALLSRLRLRPVVADPLAKRRRFRPQLEQLEDRVVPAFVITPTFDTTITSDPNAAKIEASINRVIQAFEDSFSDNITVNITFAESTSGLGGSSKPVGTFDYTSYLAALKSHATTADDNTAIASLPAGPNTPVGGSGNSSVLVTAALQNALGLAGAVSSDGSISLNTSTMNLDRTSTQDSSKYDLMDTTAHEIDEILAGGSAMDQQVNGATANSTIEPLDLFRYSANGTRSYDTQATTTSYFSIDGGATNLVGFNQYAPDSKHLNDFGDWFSNNGAGNSVNAHVQDSNAQPGQYDTLSVELRRLDVLGYTRVTTPAPVVTAPSDQTAVENSTATINLGSFTAASPNAPWGVTVSWGDGSISPIFFVNSAGSLGTLTHTYAEEGTYTATVNVTDFVSMSDSKTFKVNVSDPAVQASGVAVNAVEGAAFTGTPVATFTDPAGAEPNTSDHYKVVSIDWGDGTPLDTTSGSISLLGNTFTVSGNHTYGEEGNYTITAIIDHEGVDTTVQTTATVSDPAVVASGVAVSAVEGAAFTGTPVATFTDPGGAEPNTSDSSGTINDHYKVVSIDWGDGTALDTSSGAISLLGNTFTVSGNHTYGEEGSYTITAIIDHEGVDTTVKTTATVSDPAVIATSTPVYGVECRTLTVQVATFTDPGGAEPNPSDPSGTLNNHYKVDSINWGDGTPLDTTTGTITFSGSPGSMTDPFTVSGSHAFQHEGTYTVTTTLDHEGILTITQTTAIIKDDIGLLLLDPSGSQSLMVNGNGVVDVTGCGAAVVNSNSPTAAFVTGNASVTAEDIDVTGGVKTAGHGSFSAPIDQEAATPDPLGLSLPAPPTPTFAAVHYSSSVPLTLQPGTYVGGIALSGHASVTLAPGVYYLEGGGFSVSGQASVTGSGVTLINAPAGPNDTIRVSGQGSLNLTSPSSGPFQGVTIFQDPTSSDPVQLTGQASVTLTGVVYVPDALVQISGNAIVTVNPGVGTATLPPYLGALIAYDLKVDGNGVLTINPDDPPGGAAAAVVRAASPSSSVGGSSAASAAIAKSPSISTAGNAVLPYLLNGNLQVLGSNPSSVAEPPTAANTSTANQLHSSDASLGVQFLRSKTTLSDSWNEHLVDELFSQIVAMS